MHKEWLLCFCLICPAVSLAESVPAKAMSVAVQDADARAVLLQLADRAGINLLLSDAVQGRFSVQSRRRDPMRLLSELAASKGWVLLAQEASVWVGPPDEMTTFLKRQHDLQSAKEMTLPVVTERISLHHAVAADMAALLTASTSSGERWLGVRGRIDVDVRGNALLLTDNDERRQRLITVLHELDQPVRQVMVETRLAAISAGDGVSFGFRWRVLKNRLAMTTPLPVIGSEVSTFSYGVMNISGLTLDAELSALAAEGSAEIIARPSIMTSEHQKARISSGQQIPYQETTQSGATTTRFVNAELSLEVVPTITGEGQISMALQLSHDNAGEIQPNGARAIDTNRLSTKVTIGDGQTLVLGGIFRQQDSRSVSRVPILGNIPVLGRLFRRDVQRSDKQELLIFVTPRVVKNDEMASTPESTEQDE
ncbi:MAG: secretin N-terminal domain-containing protein [Moraxellaceae bacterium]|nr:secretin N-terminal domain-containing protein [Moraxellaceae bacterium]